MFLCMFFVYVLTQSYFEMTCLYLSVSPNKESLKASVGYYRVDCF